MIPEKIELNRKDVLVLIAIIVGIGNETIEINSIRDVITAILVKHGLKSEDISVAIKEMNVENMTYRPISNDLSRPKRKNDIEESNG